MRTGEHLSLTELALSRVAQPPKTFHPQLMLEKQGPRMRLRWYVTPVGSRYCGCQTHILLLKSDRSKFDSRE